MRIKKISSDKIVVQLTDTDLEYFDLDIDENVPQAADLHNFLFEVMELVKTETGFDPYHGGQVVVEATTSPDGMSLIISKIHNNKKRVSRDEFAKIKSVKVKNTAVKPTQSDMAELAECVGIPRTKRKKRVSENAVFIFESFSDFEAVVNVLDTFDFAFASLYRNGEQYALISRAFTVQERNIISEYATNCIRNDVVAFDINEGWTLVAKDNVLAEMAENLKEI
ncbi:MAG: adaptor protein MecA [Clostridia bacterium]|nr:adaptor protein MecA [Clostridia bacterium]